MNNISLWNLALLEMSQCINLSVGLLHYVVAVHCPSEVLRKMDTEELKCRDLFNIDSDVFSQDIRTHLQPLEMVFRKLQEHGLTIKANKCQFLRPNVTYLGHVASAEGVATDPAKTEAVTNWPKPKTLKDLRSFLGFASYYRRFVPHFTQVARPLHELVSNLYEGGKSGKESI